MPSNSLAQPPNENGSGDVVKLIYAETVKDAEGYVETTMAKGNVHFEHEQTNLFCDSALFFRPQQVVYAYGNVHINQGDTVNLYCDTLIYNGNSRVSKLQGLVRMRDNTLKLVTDSLDYDGKISTGYYTGGAVITSIEDDMKLTSKEGYYNAKLKTFFFKDSVHVSDEGYDLYSDTLEFQTIDKSAHFHGPTDIFMDSMQVKCVKGVYYTEEDFVQLWNGAYLIDSAKTLYADSLLYSQQTGIGEGFCNVDLYDSTENVQFLADYLWKSDENDTIVLKENAAVIQYSSSDTLLLMADSIFNFLDSNGIDRTSIAQKNVGIINGDLSVYCDSAHYSEHDSLIKFFENPLMWSQNTQMSADSIFATYYKGNFEQVNLYYNAFICSEKDTVHYDQIKGKFMTAWIDSSRIQKVYIELNAASNYFTAEKTKDSLDVEVEIVDGMNKIECNEIYIYFENSEIDKISFIDKPTATYFPIDQVPGKDLYIKGFLWQIGLKPQSIFRE